VHVRDGVSRHGRTGRLGAAGHDLEHAGRHERPQGRAERGLERCVHRVQLEQHGPAVLEDLRDRVGRRQARDVAGAEHEAHAAPGGPQACLLAPRIGERRAIAGRGTPHDAGMPSEDRTVEEPPLGQDVDAHERPGGQGRRGVEDAGTAAGPRHALAGNVVERPGRDREQAERGERPGGRLLGPHAGCGRQPRSRELVPRLHGHGGLDPGVGGGCDCAGRLEREGRAGGRPAGGVPRGPRGE
jgi:hypothetical protein